jgi:hypothetical protein
MSHELVTKARHSIQQLGALLDEAEAETRRINRDGRLTDKGRREQQARLRGRLQEQAAGYAEVVGRLDQAMAAVQRRTALRVPRPADAAEAVREWEMRQNLRRMPLEQRGRALEEAVRAGRYDLLFAALNAPDVTPLVPKEVLEAARARWMAEADPAAAEELVGLQQARRTLAAHLAFTEDVLDRSALRGEQRLKLLQKHGLAQTPADWTGATDQLNHGASKEAVGIH